MVFPRGYAGDDNPRTLIIDSEMNMTRTNIPGTSPFEPIIGFSRAVRIGNVVHVSGTGPVGAEELSPGEQTRAVLALIEKALAQSSARACSLRALRTGRRSAALMARSLARFGLLQRWSWLRC
jgi:hypothetical protein